MNSRSIDSYRGSAHGETLAIFSMGLLVCIVLRNVVTYALCLFAPELGARDLPSESDILNVIHKALPTLYQNTARGAEPWQLFARMKLSKFIGIEERLC